jgi:hypothetical protein
LNSVNSLEAAIDPSNRLTFLLDWELTLKCNLDCGYCGTGTYGGHDNSTRHPELAACLDTIKFMFEYADRKMSQRPRGSKFVVLNVYGGEALHHPQIVDVLKAARQQHLPYQDKWALTITTTTNALVPSAKLSRIVPLVDEFTVSYHTESSEKQKKQFRDNLLTIRDAGRAQKCVVMMHADPELFADAQHMIHWLKEHNIEHLPKQIDHSSDSTQFNYALQQVKWFDNLYTRRSNVAKTNMPASALENPITDLADTGRACCGGRQLCADQDHRRREFFVTNKFPDWYCSVDQFFLHIKQVNGEVFVNKDCKMNYQGSVGPIGTLHDTGAILAQMETSPVIQCKKTRCYCGLCAPKAQTLETYQNIMRKYAIPNSNLL